MTSNEDTLVEAAPSGLARDSIAKSRMGAYSAMGALTAVVPLPWVPDFVLQRIRGTLLHDVAAAHGLSLSEEARAILAEPWSSSLPRGVLGQAARFLVARVTTRLGPLGWLSPARSAFSTFMVGHLFERYLEMARTDQAIRIDEAEAKLIRKAMDASIKLFVTMEGSSPFQNIARAPEDLREGRTQLVDGVILSLASLPSWVVTRLEAAFDDALSRG
jgi:uncharacterized protein (DUF697 family)